MNKLLFFCLSLLFWACDDGDLQIETIDFDEITTVESCEPPTVDAVDLLLFKINGDEALILTLQNGLLRNEVSTENLVSAVPSQSQITFRILSDNVTSDYFCSAIPLVEPTIIDNIDATGGEVIISTTAGENGEFLHQIQLSGITLETSENERITDLRINDFGIVTTTE